MGDETSASTNGGSDPGPAAWIAALVVGIASVGLARGQGGDPMDAPLLPFGALAIGACAVGGLLCRTRTIQRTFQVGMTTMAPYPLLAIAEMVRDPRSHDLWPIEFVLYVLFALGAGAAAVVGMTIARAITQPPD